MVPAIGVLAFKDNQVLLVKHKETAEHLTGMYGLPAGVLGEDETEKETAVRKLKEETGLKTNEEDLVELQKTYTAEIERKNEKKEFSLKVFLCKNFSGNLKESDTEVPEWVDISELKDYSLLPNVLEAVTEGLKIK